MAVKNPKPMHPGRVLAEVYMVEMGLNQTQLADRIGCAHRKVNEIVNGKRGVTADFALDLERVLGTTAEIWVTMQAAYDLGLARRKKRAA
jgi:addiction module HigA family antidote